jgi:hypothetical protein
VRYQIAGGSERAVEAHYIHIWDPPEQRGKRSTRGRCRVLGCGSLIRDCKHTQPDEEVIQRIHNVAPPARISDSRKIQEPRCALQDLQQLTNSVATDTANNLRSSRAECLSSRKKYSKPHRNASRSKATHTLNFNLPTLEEAFDIAQVIEIDTETTPSDSRAKSPDEKENRIETARLNRRRQSSQIVVSDAPAHKRLLKCRPRTTVVEKLSSEDDLEDENELPEDIHMLTLTARKLSDQCLLRHMKFACDRLTRSDLAALEDLHSSMEEMRRKKNCFRSRQDIENNSLFQELVCSRQQNTLSTLMYI